jgi:hypothetical protein
MSISREGAAGPGVGNGGDPRDIERDIERTRANMSSTLDALERKLSPGQLLDEAMSYMETGPGAFFGNFGAAVRDNPIPVAMIGAGLAWMMFSGRRAHGGAAWEDGGYADYHDRFAGDFAERYPPAGYPPEPDHAAAAMEGAGHSEEPGIVRQVAGAASEAGRRIGDAVGGAGERVRHAAGDAADAAHRAWRQTSRRLDDARHSAGRVGRGVSHVMDEQPLLVGLVGLAVGAAIGAALPRTHREQAVFGQASDEAVRRAAEMGREQIRRARDIGTAAFEAAREEAKETGLTGEGIAGAIHEAGEKLEGVVDAGRQAAREEAAAAKSEGRRGKAPKATPAGGTFEPREGDAP